jgi:hypothetical protein
MVKIRPDRACWWLLRSIFRLPGLSFQTFQKQKGTQKNMSNKSKSRPTNQANIKKKTAKPCQTSPKHHQNITKASPKTHDPKNPG